MEPCPRWGESCCLIMLRHHCCSSLGISGSDLEHIQLGGHPEADPDQERWGRLYFSSVPGRTLCSLGGADGGRTEDVQGFSTKIANLSTCTCTICSIVTLQKLEEITQFVMGLQWNLYYQINTLHAIWRVGSSRKPCCDNWLFLPYHASAVTTGNSSPAVVRLSNRAPNNSFMVPRWGPLIFVLRYPRDQVFPIPLISVYHRSSHCPSHWRAFAIGRCRSREGWVGRGRFIRQQRGGKESSEIARYFTQEPLRLSLWTLGH